MNKTIPLAAFTLILTAGFLSGCAHRSPVSAEARYQALLDTEQAWFQHLLNGEMDAALALVSEDFTSEAYPDKAALTQYIALVNSQKMVTEDSLDTSAKTIESDESTAHIGPYHLSTHGFNFEFFIDYQYEASGWRVVGMTWSKL